MNIDRESKRKNEFHRILTYQSVTQKPHSPLTCCPQSGQAAATTMIIHIPEAIKTAKWSKSIGDKLKRLGDEEHHI